MPVNLQKYVALLLLFYGLLSSWGCHSTRYLEQGQYLLQSQPQVKSEGKIKKSELQAAIRIKPNRKILFRRTFLHIYNFGISLQRDSSFVKRQLLKLPKLKRAFDKTTNWFIHELGEPPVILDLEAIRRDSANLYNTCFALGYLRPQVHYHIDTLMKSWAHQRARLTFEVKEGKPFKISQLTYDIPDASLLQAYGVERSHLRVGLNYSHELFTRERVRATQALRDAGYFTFSQKMIRFEVDTTLAVAADSLDYVPTGVAVVVDEIPPRFTVRRIVISMKAPSDAVDLREAFKDTLRGAALSAERRAMLRISQKKLHDSLAITFVVTSTIIREINYNFIGRRVHLREGELYSLSAAQLTHRRLQELGMFQYAMINYEIVDSAALDVYINMQLAAHYQVKAGFEAFTDQVTTGTNLPSVGANFTLRNKNTLGQSELLDWNAGGNVGFYAPEEESGQLSNIFYEFGTSLNMYIPRLLIPVFGNRNSGQFSPSTSLNASFRLENLREYNRLSTGAKLTYKWFHNSLSRKTFSQFTPVSLDFIRIAQIDSAFQKNIIDKLPLTFQRDYQPRFSSRLAYSFTHSNYQSTRLIPTYFFRLNAEIGGNLPQLIDRFTQGRGGDQSASDNKLFDRFFYAQYAKLSVEGKYYKPLTEGSELVLRAIAGYSRAYGSTLVVPQESRFFSGGTNSMRGWQSNTLGPGRASLSDFTNETGINASLAAPGGEILLELNAELRFDLISYLEMALFTDVGNVWFNKTRAQKANISEASVFSGKNLVPGWDAGLGFRFDFSFLVLRFDIGQQLYAPDRGWVINRLFNEPLLRSTQINLGIGYPF